MRNDDEFLSLPRQRFNEEPNSAVLFAEQKDSTFIFPEHILFFDV